MLDEFPSFEKSNKGQIFFLDNQSFVINQTLGNGGFGQVYKV
jgi:hypothetical protein